MKKVNPKEIPTPQLHGLMLGAIGPRPIAFASTVDEDGNPNLAPFSFFNAFGSNPPSVIFSPARRVRDNTTKDTLNNVLKVKEVVINVVSHGIVEQMNLASTEYPTGVNEFEKAGFTPLPSETIKPFRVKESPVQFECKVTDVIHLGEEGGAGNLIVCEILMMHINEEVLDENGKIDQQKIDLVGRMGGNWYCRASGEALFEVAKPTRELGMGIDQLPDNIRNSQYLTGNDLGKLGMANKVPTPESVEAFKETATASNILEAHKGNPQELHKHLHQSAHQLLEDGKVDEAWKLLLCEN